MKVFSCKDILNGLRTDSLVASFGINRQKELLSFMLISPILKLRQCLHKNTLGYFYYYNQIFILSSMTKDDTRIIKINMERVINLIFPYLQIPTFLSFFWDYTKSVFPTLAVLRLWTRVPQPVMRLRNGSEGNGKH